MTGGGTELVDDAGSRPIPVLFDIASVVPESFPVLGESRARLLRALDRSADTSSIAMGLESDPALLVTALREANRGSRFQRSVASAARALEVLGSATLRSLAEKMPTVDPLDGSFRSVWIGVRFRAHALDVRRVAERIGHEIGYADRDELVASALLRDLGKLAHLATMGDNNPVSYDGKALDDRHPLLATDHAVYGALLARRWKLPERLAKAIEAQRDNDADGEAAIVLLADRLTRFGHGYHSDLRSIVVLSERVGLNRSLLTQLLYELPGPLPAQPGPPANVPLSDREIDVLRLLAQGKLYKEIASDLGLAPSTVRSHLHRIYHRMGARDRTQAVLVAIDRNWI